MSVNDVRALRSEYREELCCGRRKGPSGHPSVPTGRHCPLLLFRPSLWTSLSIDSTCAIEGCIFGVSCSPVKWQNVPLYLAGVLAISVMLDCRRLTRCESTMVYYPRHAVLLLAGTTLALSACATGPDLDLTIHESDRGAVYVERIPDRSFQTAHPITLSADTIARVLRGVVIQDGRGVLGKPSVSKPEAVRVFGDEDVEYLAPLLVEGLTRAASDQQVGFRVVKIGAPTQLQFAGAVFCVSDVRSPGVCESEQSEAKTSMEATGGSLYAYNRSLYLTLTEYRHRTDRTESTSMAHRQPFTLSGLSNRTVHFIPESAKRPDTYRTARTTDVTLMIDYSLLATMPAASDLRPTTAQSLMPTKGAPTQRDADVDELRKEMQEIKKKLADQEEERIRSSSSTAPKPTPRSAP